LLAVFRFPMRPRSFGPSGPRPPQGGLVSGS